MHDNHVSNAMIQLTIDGKPCRVQKGTTILEACRSIGIEIPTLCHLKDLAPEGGCRMCVVEVEGARKGGLPASCTEHCAEGMVVRTRSKRVVESRRFILDLLLSNHIINCFNCARNGSCKLQDYCLEYGVEKSSFVGGRQPPINVVDSTNPFYEFRPDKCIMCRRCTRVCEKLQGRDTLSTSGRGFDTLITTSYGVDRTDPVCESCGNCVSVCPTGALSSLDNKKFRNYEVTRTRTTCPHCAVGCQFDLLVKDDRIVGVDPADGPSNHGLLCVKGKYGSYKFVHAEDRLTTPLIKRDGVFERASWDEALSLVAEKLGEIKSEFGADAIAGFSCSRSPNEDNYMFQKMMRAAVGTNNIDNCARV